MTKVKISKFVNFDGTGVPQAEDGQFLDWRGATEFEAMPLTNPWGDPLHFHIGNDDSNIVLDYARLPNNNFIVKVTGSTDLLTLGHLYLMFEPTEILVEVWKLTESILRDLNGLNIRHDVDYWAADSWYFFRNLCKEVGKTPYSLMDDNQLRFDDKI